MESATVNPPLIDCLRDGVVIPDMERPVDGHLPVGPEFHAQQLSRYGQQHPPTAGHVKGVPAIPGDQQAMFHGLASIGPGPAQATPYGNVHPGGLCHHAPCPGLPVLSLDQMMLRCSKMMGLLVQQQHQLQQVLATMAAAPSSSIRTVRDLPLQQQSEVTSATQRSPAPCQLVFSTNPHGGDGGKVCHEAPWDERLHSRAHTNIIINTSTSMLVASTAQPKRAREAAEIAPQPAGEMFSAIIGDDQARRKLVQDAQQPGNDDVDNPGQRFQPKPANPSSSKIAQVSASTTAQIELSADAIDQAWDQLILRSGSCMADGATHNDIGRHKQVKNNPNNFSSWPSYAEHVQTGVFKASGGFLHFIMWQQQHPWSPCKVVANAAGSLQQYIAASGLRPEAGNSMSYFGQLPPWPPPVCNSSSPTRTFKKFRGGRQIVQSLWILPICQSFCQQQQKVAKSEPSSCIKLKVKNASCHLYSSFVQPFVICTAQTIWSHDHHIILAVAQAVSILPEPTSVVVNIVVLP